MYITLQLRIAKVAQRIDAADQLVELEYRFASSILLGIIAQLPDQRALGHFLKAECGHDLIDIEFLLDDQLGVPLSSEPKRTKEIQLMSSDNQFTALGPAIVGFQTDGANIDRGADITGNQVGVHGRCGGPVGNGVEGFGTGNFSGVAGFGGGDANGHDGKERCPASIDPGWRLSAPVPVNGQTI